MHPSHLVSRYLTVYEFHLRHYAEYAARVRAWQERRQEGGIMDEPATVKTLTAALLRADLALGLRRGSALGVEQVPPLGDPAAFDG